ncbi:MAG: HAD family hydrolase, partial [Chloroflexi bacterium]|nr:HAD family hydrolase [Chloroflexota bacterium]
MSVRAVVFDVGETLVDETRMWCAWADHLRIPRLTFLAALGAIIARGGDHRAVFELFRPGLDVDAEVEAQAGTNLKPAIRIEDLYPDALPCLQALADGGYRLGVAGNQPGVAEGLFRALPVSIELIGSSAGWGLEKPDPRFFERVAAELNVPAAQIAYVGDRLDNDVIPSGCAGMRAVFVRRGP